MNQQLWTSSNNISNKFIGILIVHHSVNRRALRPIFWKNSMKVRSIKFSIAAIMLGIGSVMLTQIGVGLRQLSGVNQAVEQLHGDILPSMTAANAMNASIAQLRASEAQLISATTDARRLEAQASVADAKSVWKQNYDFYLGLIDPEHKEERANFEQIGSRYQKYLEDETKVFEYVNTKDTKSAFSIFSEDMADIYFATKSEVNKMVVTNKGEADDAYTDSQSAFSSANVYMIGLGTLACVLLAIAAWFTGSRIASPISSLIATMQRIVAGDLLASVPFEKRRDEVGDMARTVSIFKENAIAKRSADGVIATERRLAEDQRTANDVQRQETAADIEFAVEGLAKGMASLAGGNLAYTIDTPFTGKLEQLRDDINSSVASLRETLLQIERSSVHMQDSGKQMAGAADDLAKRTEKQAAALEETAAAVQQITVTVNSASLRAVETQTVVQTAMRNAESSAGVVQNAISAMARITDASGKIAQIIDVIDQIAFQTNLLALNAGVEAARAGDAGRGFAVVAQEVRELAQRSSKAAKEIDSLIKNTSAEVAIGSRHVEETGDVLIEIARQIVVISSAVELMTQSGREQATSLQDVNSSETQMDQMTQRNAAMVEESNAATRQLAQDADRLMELVGRFILSDQAVAAHTLSARRAA
jgi:methyl-accepting chemotaxis protein